MLELVALRRVPGVILAPKVLGPDEVPAGTSPAVAVLSADAHGPGKHGSALANAMTANELDEVGRRFHELLEMSEKTILIIDDEEDLRDTLKLSLELEGYRCYTAANGREGLEALERIPPPHVILLDLMMPVLNGWQFMDELRGHPSFGQIPVVVVTAFIKLTGAIRASDIIRKPIEMDTLLGVLKKHCS